MSEVMLLGVLRMPRPTDPKDLSLIDWMQFNARVKEAADELETAWAERDAAIAERAAAETEGAQHWMALQDCRRDLAAARALADKLARVLRPVAEISACYDPDDGDDEQPVWDRRPTIGMLRAARAALAEYDKAKDSTK